MYMDKQFFNYDNWKNKNNRFIQYEEIQSKLIFSSLKLKKLDVCIVIPAYKRVETLNDCIRSIWLQKTYFKYAVIVVDDSGDDMTIYNYMKNIVKKKKNLLYYKNERNLGQAANWNRCIELSLCKWIVLLHDDDMLMPNYIETVLPIAISTNCNELGIFQTKLDLLEHKNTKSKRYNKSHNFAQKLFEKCRKGKAFTVHKKDMFQFITPSPGCWLINQEKAFELGGFDEDFGVTTDGIFHFKNIYYGKVIIVPQFLMIRRIEKNIFLNSTAQIKVINMLYFFGLNLLQEYDYKKKKYLKFLLNISIIYLSRGIKDKYNGTIDLINYLTNIGVDKKLIILPRQLIYLLNNFFLLKLIFRKD